MTVHDRSYCSHGGSCEQNLIDHGGAFCANLPTVHDDDAEDELLREIYGRAFGEGAESTILQWQCASADYNKLNSGCPTMPHEDCKNEGAYQFIEDVKPKLQALRLSPTIAEGVLREALELIANSRGGKADCIRRFARAALDRALEAVSNSSTTPSACD
jgi:hypothetical protein